MVDTVLCCHQVTDTLVEGSHSFLRDIKYQRDHLVVMTLFWGVVMTPPPSSLIIVIIRKAIIIATSSDAEILTLFLALLLNGSVILGRFLL